MHLAAAGVGTLGIVDADRVDISNLQRQLLHGTGDIGREKTTSAADRIRELNPLVKVERHTFLFTEANAMELVGGYDLALGCVDNFTARRSLNAACVKLGKPNIFGAAARLEGQASVFSFAGGPCYHCFFRDPPTDWQPSPAEKAVLGVVPGIIGTIQATEAIKILLRIGAPLAGRLLLFDALAMAFREIRVRRDPDCPACGHPCNRNTA